MAASTLAEALAECEARKLGPSSCAELVAPFCEGRGVVMQAGSPVRCVGGETSDRKAAILLNEAQARVAASRPPWLLIGGGVAAVALIAYIATR